MATNPSSLLFGAYRREVLGLLLRYPDRSFYVRELGRLTGFPAGTLTRELTRLADAGLLSRHKVGNQVHYRANRGSPIFEELAGIFRKTSAQTIDAVAETPAAYATRSPSLPGRAVLHKVCRRYHVSTLSMFGSTARGESGPRSDIDLLVEFEPGHAPGLGRLLKFRTELAALFDGREVDIVTPQSLDNPYRRKAILSDQRVLYAA